MAGLAAIRVKSQEASIRSIIGQLGYISLTSHSDTLFNKRFISMETSVFTLYSMELENKY